MANTVGRTPFSLTSAGYSRTTMQCSWCKSMYSSSANECPKCGGSTTPQEFRNTPRQEPTNRRMVMDKR